MIESLAAVLASSAIKVVSRRLRGQRVARPNDGLLVITTSAGETLTLDPEKLDPEFRGRLDQLLLDNQLDGSLSDGSHATEGEVAVAGAIALLSPDAVFQDARRRVNFVFRLRLGIALALAVVLIGTLAGLVISLALGNEGLAAGLGAIAVADLIGATIFKPLDKMRENLVDTQRLDLLHLMARQQLADAGDLPLEQRLEFQQAVWTRVLANVGTLSAGQPPG